MTRWADARVVCPAAPAQHGPCLLHTARIAYLLPALFEPTDADLEYERQLLALEAEIKADLAVLYEARPK